SHGLSRRKARPFWRGPGGARRASLREGASFGHVKGAFTGADRAKVGKFEAAGQGPLLLDEIDTLGLEQQAGLLRVLETGEYEPVGSNETRQCQARLIVASNWDLEQAVAEGRFRQDLFYRLNVMSFHLPPLRERVGGIAPLRRAGAGRHAAKSRREVPGISRAALGALEASPWRGNVRQLENFVQHAVLLGSGPELLPEPLPERVRNVPTAGPAPA